MCSHFVSVTGGEVARLLMVKSERLAQRKFRTRFAALLVAHQRRLSGVSIHRYSAPRLTGNTESIRDLNH